MGNNSTRFGSKRDITLILLGLDNAGKTTILENLADEDTEEEQIPTVGYSSRRIVKGRYNILLMDLGGGPDIRGIWPKYYAETHGIIYVVDTSDRERINESKEKLREVLRDERMTCKPLLVLCNKADKKKTETMGVVEVLEGLELINLLKESASIGEDDTEQPKTRLWLCSALKSKTNNQQDRRMKRGIWWLLGSITRHWEVLSPRVSAQHGVELEQKERERKERIERRRRKIEEEERLEAEALKRTETAEKEKSEIFQPTAQGSTPVLHVTAEVEDDTDGISKLLSEETHTRTLKSESLVPKLDGQRSKSITEASPHLILETESNTEHAGTQGIHLGSSSSIQKPILSNDTQGKECSTDAPPAGTSQSNETVTQLPSVLAKKNKLPPLQLNPATNSERRDSGMSSQEGSTLTMEEEGPVTIDKIPELPVEQVTRKKTRKPGKIVMRLKNRNRTFPTTEELPSAKEQSSLAEASPLASPWVTPNTDLPIDHDKPTKSDSVGGGDTSLDTTVDQRTIGNGGLIRQTLPPINSTNHPSGKAFILPQDSVLPLPVSAS